MKRQKNDRLISRSELKNVIMEATEDSFQHLNLTDLEQLRKKLNKRLKRGTDIKYIKTLLFPETCSYDIAMPGVNLAYTRFDHKENFTINTGACGCGMVAFYPKSSWGPSGWVYIPNKIALDTNTTTTGTGIELPSLTTAAVPYQEDDDPNNARWHSFMKNDKYCDYYQQLALVACSFSVQYIGRLDSEAGQLVGSHINGRGFWQLTKDDIENGQYVTRTKPGKGIRFCYMPRDNSDFEFYQCQKSVYTGDGAKNSFQFGAQKIDQYVTDNNNGKFTKISSTVAYDTSWAQGIAPPPTVASLADKDQYLIHQSAPYFAFYWEGLEESKEWLRFDITKKFNAVPKSEFRDFTELKKPTTVGDSDKTMDSIVKLSTVLNIGTHTLSDFEQGPIAGIKSNIYNLDQVLNSVDEDSMSLQQFDQKLSNPRGIDGITGPLAEERMYQQTYDPYRGGK